MSISQINGYSYTNAIQKSQNRSVATTQTESSSTGQSVDGVKKYDFTNISRGELLNTVNGLIKSGQMSLDESSSLVLLMGPKIGTDGSNIDVSDEKVDVFSMLQQSLAYNETRSKELATLTAEQRYQKLIKNYPEILHNVPLQYIASFLGMNAKSLSRIRKEIIK